MFKSKKIKTILSVLFMLLVITLFYFNNSVLSAEEQQNDVATISEDETEIETTNLDEDYTDTTSELEIIEKDVYLLGESSVTIDYLIDGNLFIISNDTVTITSEVGGSAFIMAPNVIIENTGAIYYTAYILAENLTIHGQVTDLYSCSSNLTISNTSIIYRDIHSFSETIDFAGIVGRNASFSANTITLTPGSNGNNAGIIYGNLDYSSSSEIENVENVVIGETNYTKTSSEDETASKSMSVIITEKVKSLITYLIFVLAVWGLFKLIKSNYSTTSKQLLKTKPLQVLGIGILALITIPVISFILLFSSFTIRISAVLILAYIILLLVSTSIFTIALSEILCEKYNKQNKFLILVLSIIGLWVLGIIPVIGVLISFASLLFGLGIIVLSLFNKNNTSIDEKTEVIVEEQPKEKIVEEKQEEISQDKVEEIKLDNLIENLTENKDDKI